MKKIVKLSEILALLVTLFGIVITILSFKINNLNFIELGNYSIIPNSNNNKNSQEGLIISKNTDINSLTKKDKVVYIFYEDNSFVIRYGVIRDITKQNNSNIYSIDFYSNKLNKIDSSCIIGKYVFKLPLVGTIINYMLTRDGFLLFIVSPLLLVTICELFNFIEGLNKKIK